MNPFERLNIYGNDIIKKYEGKPFGQEKPHLYAIAENAFRSLVKEGLDQSIVVR